MARGHIYYITTDEHKDVGFDESSYYGRLDALDIDYVLNQTKEDSEIPLEWLQELMQKAGAAIGYGYDNGSFAFSFCFEKTEKMQQDYFRPKLEKLKKETEALTLFDVIRAAPSLDTILDNQYGDLVELDDGETESLVSMDTFIRRIKPGTIYYVYECVILAH